MTSSKDLPPSTKSFGAIFYNNQFKEKPVYPSPNTNLSGKVGIVTGANTGLGYEATIQLLNLKLSHVILAVRSTIKGKAAAAKLQLQFPTARIDVWELDMSSYDSIQAFARRVDSELPRIDYVLLNAGVIKKSLVINPSTGHEETVQVNYLSTVLLAILLLPILKAKGQPSQPARLTIVSAALTLAATFPNQKYSPIIPSFDDPKNFNGHEQYNSSKLLAHMFLWKLVDYVSAEDVIINLADPAYVRGTDLAREHTGILIGVAKRLFESLGRTPQVGASCLVDGLLNHGKESHGCFLMSWKIHPFPTLLYGEKGEVLIDTVWEETVAELKFAGVNKILDGLKM